LKKKAIMAALSVTAILISLVGMQLVEVATANFFPPSVPSPAITITRDGSVVPQTAPITRVNDVYTLTDNIVGYTIVVQLNNLVIDGNGYTLQGNGNSTGVFLQDTQNVTVKNLTIKECSRGVGSHGALHLIRAQKTDFDLEIF
jgi:hypothetical protein